MGTLFKCLRRVRQPVIRHFTRLSVLQACTSTVSSTPTCIASKCSASSNLSLRPVGIYASISYGRVPLRLSEPKLRRRQSSPCLPQHLIRAEMIALPIATPSTPLLRPFRLALGVGSCIILGSGPSSCGFCSAITSQCSATGPTSHDTTRWIHSVLLAEAS